MGDFRTVFNEICKERDEDDLAEWAIAVREAGHTARLHGDLLDSAILDAVSIALDERNADKEGRDDA